MPVELHLPDLPEIPVALGPLRLPPESGQAPRLPTPWHVRLRETLSSYLPLLLMALLALSTWWLVKHTPRADGPSEPAALRKEPDYTMSNFALQRFDRDGRLSLRLDGRQMRHLPDLDRIEVDGVRLQSWAQGGRVTRASARRAIGNGDASELQLQGDATVVSSGGVAPGGQKQAPIEFRSEFLHAFVATERAQSHLPVQVLQGGNDIHAAGFAYDHLAGRLDLTGPVRMIFPPRVK
jgi:lipopolysaccharide export system protein LptC